MRSWRAKSPRQRDGAFAAGGAGGAAAGTGGCTISGTRGRPERL
jgi:hypothetical protein